MTMQADEEYGADEEAESDDEETLEAEEAEEEAEAHDADARRDAEVDALNEEAEMSIDELKAKYGHWREISSAATIRRLWTSRTTTRTTTMTTMMTSEEGAEQDDGRPAVAGSRGGRGGAGRAEGRRCRHDGPGHGARIPAFHLHLHLSRLHPPTAAPSTSSVFGLSLI